MGSSFLNNESFEVFVIIAETLEGWKNPMSEEGKVVLKKHYLWGEALKNNNKLILAGPMNIEKEDASVSQSKVGITTGLIILNVHSREEAEELAYSDPFHLHQYRKNIVHSMKVTVSHSLLFNLLKKIIN